MPRRRIERVVGLAVVALTLAVLGLGAAPPARGAGSGDPSVHLAGILDLTRPPEHRRFGSPGMAAAADYAAEVLGRAGYTVLRHEVASHRWFADYTEASAPSVRRTSDGHAFPTEAVFGIGATTGPAGRVCTVRLVDDVTPGDCGLVAFQQVSPEWHNVFASVPSEIATVATRGGVAVILQGDPRTGSRIAIRSTQAIPAVVAVADPAELVGQQVRVRVVGGDAPAVLHDVVAVRPPTDPSRGYVVLQGHLDGWFAAAADNAAGAAAVLAAAERLAGDRGGRGLLVALYDGEEWGLLGSRALTRDLARPEGLAVGACGPVVRLRDVVTVVNLDAPSAVGSEVFTRLRTLGAGVVPLVSYRVLVSSEEPTVAALLSSTMTGAGVLGLPVTAGAANVLNSGMQRTDARWFHEAGIPVAWPVAGYPQYHTEADHTESVDPVDLANVVTGATALVRALDDAPVGRLVGSTLPAPGGEAPPAPAASCRPTPAAPGTTVSSGAARGSIPATGGGPRLPLAGALVGGAAAARALSRRAAVER